MKTTRNRKRITHAIVGNVTLTFMADGIHVHQKFSRAPEKVISLEALAKFDSQTVIMPTRANPHLPDGSAAEALDVAACDLCTIAMTFSSKKIDRSGLKEAKRSTAKALKILNGLELVA